MTRAPEAVRRLFRVADNRATMFKPLNAIFPGYEAEQATSALTTVLPG